MMVRRSPDLVDFYIRDSQSVVMAGTNVVRLTELSTFVVETCSDWTPVADLAASLTERFGPPPGPADAVATTSATVRELADLRIVEVTRAERLLQVSEARDVLAAMVCRVAQDAGIDLMLIKGASLSHHGLRTPRAWGDVDVLVRPSTEPKLRRILEDYGWTVPDEPSPRPLPIAPHALTLTHPRWYTEIDVHHYFPGCYADPTAVFDLFWSGRIEITSAHQPVPTTGLHASALIAALNLMRGPEQPWTRPETAEWTEAVAAWDDADRKALAELAAATGAADTVAPLLDRVGAPPIDRGTTGAADLADWADRVAAARGDGYEWGLAVRRAPLLRKPSIALKALMFDADAYLGGRATARRPTPEGGHGPPAAGGALACRPRSEGPAVSDKSWRRVPDAAWVGDADRVVAARTSPPDREGPRVLEGVAAWVWLALDEPSTTRDLTERALADGAPETVRRDVRTALADLKSAGLAQPA